MVADTPAQQGLQVAAGAEPEDLGNACSGTVTAGSVSDNSNPASDSDSILSAMTDGSSLLQNATLLDVAEAPEPVAPEYELPTWAEFRGFVMDNGDKYVRASYPNSPADLIETIWCGVPVIEHDQARVMTPKGEWLVY